MTSLAALIAAAIVAAQTLMLPPIDPGYLAELNKRRPAEAVVRAQQEVAEEMAATLRERFDNHPKQRAFWQSIAKRLAALCTRRAGKSDGGVHEWLAKAISIPGWRGVYINTTKDEAKKIVWRNDLGAGWIDLIAKHGSVEGDGYRIGGLFVKTNETALTIDFSNGAQIALFAADDEMAINKLRGQAKDEVWIDEAQKMPHLRPMITSVISPLVKDKRGVIRLTGTPSEDCAGYFYEVTPEESSRDVPLKGWEVHRWSVTDNPGFACVAWIDGQWFVTESNGTVLGGPYDDEATADKAAVTIRWDRTAGEALEENGWTGLEPEFLREWMGQWVKSDARYVYPVHAAPQHTLVYAPQRLADNPVDASHAIWYDHEAALLDLPRRPTGRPHDWMFGVGADFGYQQTPFALAVLAFTFELPGIYEMMSWKQHKVLPDDQRKYIELLWNGISNIIALVGDPAGQKSADLEAWRTRFSLPIDDADKSAKNTWQELMAGDIRKGHFHYREGSPLLHEHKHLVYLPSKPGKTRKDDEFRRISDGTVPGNDCSDCGVYAYKYMNHHRYRDQPKDQRSAEAKIADEHEARLDRADEIRQAMIDAGDDDMDGGYAWEDG